MKRKRYLNQLREGGYQAALAGEPCEAPVGREMERAAWEIGWRAAYCELYRATQGWQPQAREMSK